MTRTEHVALKGTRDGLILYLDPEADFGVVLNELERLLRDSAQFLQGAAVRCYGGEKEYSEQQKEELTGALARYKLEFSGWLTAEDVYVAGRNSTIKDKEKEMPRLWDEGMVEGNCLFVQRTLRSGTSIQYDGHVIVLGDINPGAEVIASGNIVVLGALRGVAHAGATGERQATVSAYHLAPTQLRIADLVARPPESDEDWRGPEIAKVKDNQLIVESLLMTGLRGKSR